MTKEPLILTRRDLLRLIPPVFSALTYACASRADIPAPFSTGTFTPTETPPTIEPLIPPELIPLVDEIKTYRALYGITELPFELSTSKIQIAKQVTWTTDLPSFNDPYQNTPYKNDGIKIKKNSRNSNRTKLSKTNIWV